MGDEGRLGMVLASMFCLVCISPRTSLFIYCFCQSWLVVRFPPPHPFPSWGPIICWLPSNGPRIVGFGSGAVYRDFGGSRGRSGLGPLGTDRQLRTLPQRILFSLFVFVDLYFSLSAFSLLWFQYTMSHRYSDHRLAPWPQLHLWFWVNLFFGGLCFRNCKIQCLCRRTSKSLLKNMSGSLTLRYLMFTI